MQDADWLPSPWWVLFVGIAEVSAFLFGIIFTLYKSSYLPSPALLIMAHTLVTLVILVLFAITRESDVLTLAGVPIGALVTAATFTFRKGDGEEAIPFDDEEGDRDASVG